MMSFDSASTFLDPRDENAFLRSRLKQLQGILDGATKAPNPRATVLEVGAEKSLLVQGNNPVEVVTPSHVTIAPGDQVHVDVKTSAVLDVIKDPFVTGPVRKVMAVLDDRHAEVSVDDGHSRMAVLFHREVPKVGDRVILDRSLLIILRNLGPEEPNKGPIYETGVSWDDILGQDEAVAMLRDAIEGPIRDADLRKRYGKKRTRGALIAGPPGCGKTLLARAAATALATLHGRESTASGYQYAKGPELLGPLVGTSEAGVRKLFSNAKTHRKEHGYPCIICLDEGDALLGRRDNVRIAGMEKTIVPSFLAEMDGIEDSGAFVLVLTNRPDMLDAAITRDGRLDLKIYVSRPTQDGATAILGHYLKDRPLDGLTVEEAASLAAEEIYHRRHVLYVVRTKSGKGDARFTLGSLVSGAMCAGLVERATDYAIARDRTSKTETGIRASDLTAAADRMCDEQRMLDHSSDLEDVVRSVRDDLRSIDKTPRKVVESP